MASQAESWSEFAFNQVPDSNNKIHGDEVAKQYGFKGGLVPGVTLSAYLVHPAVEAWGEDWLNRGYAHIKILSPVYDGNQFFVNLSPQQQRYTAVLLSDDVACAEADVVLTDELPPAPKIQNDNFIEDDSPRPPATREVMEAMLENGCPAMQFEWRADHNMASYLRDPNAMPGLLRTTNNNVQTSAGKANLSFLLSCANRHFAAVASMSPWVHLETKSQNFRLVNINTRLISEMQVLELFSKKGHEFADCEFNLFEAASGQCVCAIWQRAIYQLRQAV